jgi:DegV family protein with EDD domain
MVRIITDGAADMPPAWEKEFDVQIVPINIQFGEKTFLQYEDIDNEGFYKLVDETKKIPKTAQPSPHQFVEFYEKVAKAGDTIISIHVTSKLSGTFDSAVAAAREVAGKFKVFPIDSFGGSAGIGFMCREARLMDRAGKSTEEIVRRIESIRERVGIFLTLDTLDYARMSGRVGTLQAALASILNVKPLVVLKNGMLDMTEKVRTRRAALERTIEMAREKYSSQPLHIAVVQARDPQSGRGLMEMVKDKFNIKDLIMTDLSIAVAANLGPGTVGLVLYPTD